MTLLTVSNNTSITGPFIRRNQGTAKNGSPCRNPKHEENERKGFSNWDVPRELCY